MRDIVLGNGTMMLSFDKDLSLRDLYWPYGGFENHGDGNRTSFGIYADEHFSWLFSPDWEKDLGYLCDTPITNIKAVNNRLDLELTINDAIHWAEDVYLKRIVIKNLRDHPREVKVIFYQDFSIRGIEAGDSAVYDPKTGGIYHYKKSCYILANCMSQTGGATDYSAGVKRYQGKEGTFKDAEDGMLSLNPIADGPVDSAIGVTLTVPAGGEGEVYYWLIAGYRLRDLRTLNERFLSRQPEYWMEEMARYYRAWIKRGKRDFKDLSKNEVVHYKSSLFTIKSQLDRKGAVVASPDADNFLVARDHYMYLWPRDGALVAHALDMAGFPEDARRFYAFCSQIISEEGYFLQRYNTDGTPGCTWHPMVIDGKEIPPIQEDETALVIWALGRHYQIYEDLDFIQSMYNRLIKPALDFMASYIDPATGLVGPSWDLWEERRGIMGFTCGAVYGALHLGETMALAAGDPETARKCKMTANMLRESIIKHLYHPGLGRFLRGLFPDWEGKLHPDYTLDASLYGLFGFGAFAADDERIEKTMTAIADHLWVKTEIGGIARYTGDYYHRVSDDTEQVPGNPWILTTLWLADWYLARKAPDDLKRAHSLISWAVNRAGQGQLLPEQVHPYSGAPMSVCPLTWSHSTLVKVTVDYLNALVH